MELTLRKAVAKHSDPRTLKSKGPETASGKHTPLPPCPPPRARRLDQQFVSESQLWMKHEKNGNKSKKWLASPRNTTALSAGTASTTSFVAQDRLAASRSTLRWCGGAAKLHFFLSAFVLGRPSVGSNSRSHRVQIEAKETLDRKVGQPPRGHWGLHSPKRVSAGQVGNRQVVRSAIGRDQIIATG